MKFPTSTMKPSLYMWEYIIWVEVFFLNMNEHAFTSSTALGMLIVSENAYLSANVSTDPFRFTIVCETTGGPATNVIWRKDGNLILHEHALEVQTVTSYEDATYLNEIILPDSIIAGEYRIDVFNAVNSVSSTLNVSGTYHANNNLSYVDFVHAMILYRNYVNIQRSCCVKQ